MGRLFKYVIGHQINRWIVFIMLVYLVLVIKLSTMVEIDNNWFFGVYSVLTSAYILSRFLLAHFYNPYVKFDIEYQPTVTFVTPAKNEGENIAQTLRAIIRSDYPKTKFEIIAINDGSTDETLSEMLKVQREAEACGVPMKVINWTTNRGKRPGMAEGVLQSKNEIICFVDSDSFVEPETIQELIKYFADPTVAAVAGHADVYNRHTNLLTKMQAIRYSVAFKAYKGAEALFGSVTCCSGCCSAYRREYVMEILDDWLNQRFLGTACTYGDDRSLTNFLLKKYKTYYSPTAQCYTVVPDDWKTFFKQQLRWKKSWTRESARASLIMWRKNPITAISFFVGVMLPLISPVVVFRALLWMPTWHGVLPWVYISGLVLMSGIYGLYYYIHTKDRLWVYGVLFAWLYSLILVWQLPYAIMTLRDGRWGTR